MTIEDMLIFFGIFLAGRATWACMVYFYAAYTCKQKNKID